MKSTGRVAYWKNFIGRKNRIATTAVAFCLGFLFVVGAFLSGSTVTTQQARAAQADFQGGATDEMLAFALNFRSAGDFAVFGGRSVHNQGNSVIRGRVGSTGTVSGILGIDETRPENHGQAKQDLKDALRAIKQLPCADVPSPDLAGKTFGPGVYCLASANLAGEMLVSGGGDANARFVFRVAGDLTASAGSSIRLANAARAANVFIIADGDASVGAGSTLNANLISDRTVRIGDRTTIAGKSIGVHGDVDIINSTIGGGTGFIEICKALSPGDPIPVGTLFTFTISGVTGTIQVPAGSCSAPIEVAEGNVTVTEGARANTAVISIVTNPANRRVSFNLNLRQVVVAVPEGTVQDETVVTFTNQTTRTGTIEICKRVDPRAPTDPDVTGFFQFTAQGAPGQTFSVPVGFCSGPITLTILQVPGTPFTADVTELARVNFRLEDVTTFPIDRLNTFTQNAGFDANGNPIPNINGGFANVDLIVNGGPSQATIVNFFNRSLPGVFKVCKITADTVNIPIGTLFRFTVTGLAPTSPTQTLPGTVVTRTVDVPAGPDAQGGFCEFVEGTFVVGASITVVETGLAPGETLPGGLTFADTRVSRIRSSTAPATVNLATRTIVTIQRNTTTFVDFTNYIFRPAVLKICKIAGTGVTPGTIFNFTLALVNPLTSLPVSTAPIPVPAGSCTFANGPFPADPSFPGIGTFNFGTQIIVTEAAAAGTTLTAITSPTAAPGGLVVDLPNRRGTLTLNQALLPGSLINEINFTNTAAVVAPVAAARFDFDGDGKSDPVIFRPSTGVWWYGASSAGGQHRALQFGLGTDRVVAADYDGDRKTDYAIYRNGEWHILGSSSGYSVGFFGVASDIPQPGDYDGDGRSDLAVYRPSEGMWYLQRSRDGFAAVRFGLPTDSPEAADFDGDGRMDLAVYRGGTWYLLGSTAGFSAVQFGLPADRPVPADYDGDGRADVAVYRNGEWHVLKSSGSYFATVFGMAGDTPVQADYDGDGQTDLAVFRSSTNMWHLMRSGSTAEGTGYTAFVFGTSGDVLMNY